MQTITNIGFIGAGKVGCSLGRYFSRRATLVGYASKSFASAQQAATLTNSCAWEQASSLCEACDTLFITTPDDQIAEAWGALKKSMPAASLNGKIICHCSGAAPSSILEGAEKLGASVYSVHPLFAISSKTLPVEELQRAFFTLEGSKNNLPALTTFMEALGNSYTVISAEHKTRYHAAAALASNHVVGLYKLACEELERCGFTAHDAEAALAPLFLGNAEHIAHDGTLQALTGPAQRGDMKTINKHLDCLDGTTHQVYALLNDVLLELAEEKRRANY